MRPRARVLAFAALSLLSATSFGIDLEIGAGVEASYAAGYLGSAGADMAALGIEPVATLSGDWWDARVAFALRGGSDPSDAALSLVEAGFRAWLGDHLVLRAGVALDESFAAEIFPLTSFLGPADPLDILEGGSVRHVSEPLVEVALGLGPFRASALVAPFAPPLALSRLDSPWFPVGRFPESVTDGESEYSFGGVSYSGGAEGPQLEFLPSARFRLDAFLGSVDLSASWFHGSERNASLAPRYFPAEPFVYTYRIELEPRRFEIDALTFSAAGDVGALRLWLESALTFGGGLVTGRLKWGMTDISILEDGTVDSLYDLDPVEREDSVAATAGASWRGALGDLVGSVLVEGMWKEWPWLEADIEPPFLSRMLAASFKVSEAGERWDFGVMALASLGDLSGIIMPNVSVSLGGERRLGLTAPFFVGAAEDDFGLYTSMHYLALVYTDGF